MLIFRPVCSWRGYWGAPATVKKELSGNALDWIERAPGDYQRLQARYRAQGMGVVPEEFAGS